MNGGAFTATYNDAGAEAANRDAGTAQFVMSSGSSIVTGGGAISITGGAGNPVSPAGDIALGTLTTTGPANTSGTAGGDVTVTTGAGGGNVVAAGTITTAGAALTSGNNADGNSGGNVNLAGANVTVAAINTSGSSARGPVSHAGGNAGNITLDANGATPTIALNGNVTATGGDSTGNSAAAGNGGAVTLMDPVTIHANVVVNAQRGAGTTVQNSGKVWFQGTVNADAAANNRTLTINTGGTTEFDGALGGVQSLASITTDSAGDAGEVTQLGGNVTTSGSQTYNDAVVQSANVHLTGGALTLGPSWNAASHDLQLTFSSGVTVPSVFANVANFTSDGAGGTTFSGNFTTFGQSDL